MIRERFGLHPRRWYLDAKELTEDEFLAGFHWDHNVFHSSSEVIDNPDVFWNLAPMPIQEHLQKTKTDLKVIAKGRRIRKRQRDLNEETLLEGLIEMRRIKARRKIKSRGFDKRYRKKLDGTVVKRDE